MPVENWLAGHCAGVAARAVAVEELPDVLLAIVEGKSPEVSSRKDGEPVPLAGEA
jgi:hypothetical protein